MAAPLKLFYNVVTKRLVAFRGGATSVPSLYQYNVFPIELTLVEPTGNVSSPYQAVDVTGATLRAALGPAPQGITGPDLLAFYDGFSYDTSTDADWPRFTGSFPINTTEVDDYIDEESQKQVYFSLTLVNGDDFITLLQVQLTLYAVIDEGAATAPTPAESYYTATESDNRYVRKTPAAGETMKLVSPNGLKTLTLSLNNDGELVQSLS